MFTEKLIFEGLKAHCPFIHETRLNAVIDVAYALRESQNLTLSAMGRHLSGDIKIKNKIKKVDRLEGNEKLHKELFSLYQGLSKFVFQYVSEDKGIPVVIDLCFMKDDREIQMLSAEVATKGRSLPLYREVFKEGELKGRAKEFLNKLRSCIPTGREVIIIMDAGFFEDWFKEIEELGWYWICRIRQGKTIKLSEEKPWQSVHELIPEIPKVMTDYQKAFLTRRHQRACRIVTTRRILKGRKVKISRGKTTSKLGRGSYSSANKEPWILATNLTIKHKPIEIINMYAKRMQIEESFRDLKSHQFGLSARYIRTKCIHRWGVKMLLAAIVQITYWVIGIIGHSQGLQKYFQANTVRDRKIFSYFTLGKLMIEHDGFRYLQRDERSLTDIINMELTRKW